MKRLLSLKKNYTKDLKRTYFLTLKSDYSFQGLDSSAIAHFASERLQAYVPSSFTASFKDDASIDKSIDAFNTASRLKFNHFEVALTQEKFIERLDEATMIIEEP